jgi:alkylation response protein AidB-like acyl-CoA dehydrogenase
LIPLNPSLYPNITDPRTQSARNGILIHRLKNKFGTQIVPTAELSLRGSYAQLIGGLDQGVKAITPVLNITRVHSAVGSVGYVRKALSLATSYASVRRNGPKRILLRDIPLHLNELAKLTVTYKALVHFTFEVVRLLGRVECQTADESARHRLRALTPVLKAFCAEKGVQTTIECMTALGGEGYMEENSIGRLVRDGIVEKIWEGTTTVLSLDMIRAFQTRGTVEAFSQASGPLRFQPYYLSNFSLLSG